jgi:hypothetical protein
VCMMVILQTIIQVLQSIRNVCKIVLLDFVHHLNQWRVLHGLHAALIGLSCGFQTNSIVVYYYSSLYVPCVEDRFSAPKK